MYLCACAFEGTDGSAAVRRLLARVLSERYGAALPAMARTATGKPYFPDRPEIHFSLSHTKGFVLCAVGDVPVGADVERIRAIDPRVPDRISLPEERAAFDFFDLWTLKESYIKLFDAPETPLRSIVFTGERGAVCVSRPGVYARLYDGIPGCRAAVCALTPALPARVEII